MSSTDSSNKQINHTFIIFAHHKHDSYHNQQDYMRTLHEPLIRSASLCIVAINAKYEIPVSTVYKNFPVFISHLNHTHIHNWLEKASTSNISYYSLMIVLCPHRSIQLSVSGCVLLITNNPKIHIAILDANNRQFIL
jgi:hypothetical protein